MPIQSATLFLVAILASTLLLGISSALKSKYRAAHLDVYFYFVVVTVSYGFVNWIGISFVADFSDLGFETSSNPILLFAAFGVPLALAKLYLFALLLTSMIGQKIPKMVSRTFYALATISIALAGYLLSRDIGSEDLSNSRRFLILFGVIILVANYLAIFYYLSTIAALKSDRLQIYARRFGWSYLIGYFVYASPYYLVYYVDVPWYQGISPYAYYAMHLIPLIFLWQFSVHLHRDSPSSTADRTNLDELSKQYDISSRERTILVLVLAGKNNSEIAARLSISPNTVRNHIYNIYGKMNVKNRIQLKMLCDG